MRWRMLCLPTVNGTLVDCTLPRACPSTSTSAGGSAKNSTSTVAGVGAAGGAAVASGVGTDGVVTGGFWPVAARLPAGADAPGPDMYHQVVTARATTTSAPAIATVRLRCDFDLGVRPLVGTWSSLRAASSVAAVSPLA